MQPNEGMTFLPLLTYASAAVGLLLALLGLWRAHRSVADWTFFAGMVLLAAESACFGLSNSSLAPEKIIFWQQWRFLVASLLPGAWLIFSLSYARGNARDFLDRWRLPLIGALVFPLAIAGIFRNDLVIEFFTAETGGQWSIGLGWSGTAVNFFLLAGAILVLMNLERTFRASVGTMRWRIKYLLMGAGLIAVVRLYTSTQSLLFHGTNPSLQSINSAGLLIGSLLMLRSLFRSGSFDLNVYPSQFVLQGSLTIFVAGIYLLIVGVFARIVARFGGDQAFGLNALLVLVALVLLALLLQSDHFRLSLHRFVSRNFQRPLYDYRTMWRKFNEGTASRVEQEDLCRSLVRLTADMFQALSVSIWLVDDKESMILAASTSLPEAQKQEDGSKKTDTSEVIQHFQMHPEPADIEASRSPWASTLREWHPGEFANGGHRVCIPLIGRGEMLGLITLGDRVGGAAYSLQDFDMLKCVGDHAAASLLNVRLSQRLLQSREHEAFQAMAAFFVHDLKNAASTLNLLLQNLPIHFDDPEFREDALRGVGKSVAHINHLISRLSQLRHELKIQPVESDMIKVITEVLTHFEPDAGFVIEQDLTPLPKLPLDADQFAKVVTNLVLNAREAMSGAGQLKISTSVSGPWAVLTTTDNGCGMSEKFLTQGLFRPFQTTKKNGLGIGMFQSKMIVEAHGGRIAVESIPGQGTTFRVFLPLTAISR